jgi:nucleoside-diphosphate-sugar epimerase
MRIFVTGATGFVGSAVVKDLLDAGHKVLGLARSDAGAKSLAAAGAEVHRGSLEDIKSLQSGAAASDGVIHTAFSHDFSKLQENCEVEARAIEALSATLAASGRPLIITSGTGLVAPGRLSTEDDVHVPGANTFPRVKTEIAVYAMAERGVNVRIVRLPQVHDRRKQGLVTYTIEVARQKGVSAYVGEGKNRWPAAHLLDAAPVYRLALEKGTAGARYHAVGEEGVPARDIAEVIGRRLNVPTVSISPEKAMEHFGWLGMFMTFDLPSSSAKTQAQLGWRPTHGKLIPDLENATAFEAAAAAPSHN